MITASWMGPLFSVLCVFFSMSTPVSGHARGLVFVTVLLFVETSVLLSQWSRAAVKDLSIFAA